MEMTKEKVSFNVNIGPMDINTIASHIGAKIYKNNKEVQNLEGVTIYDVADLRSAKKNTITFVADKNNIDNFNHTNASACIVEETLLNNLDKDIYLLVVKNPYASYIKVANLFYPPQRNKKIASGSHYISETAKLGEETEVDLGCYIGDNASIGKNVKIHPNTYIGDNVVIGDNCIIHNNVTITNTIIGHSTIVNSGAVIGKAGFGYVPENGKHIRIPHLGRVIVGNDVEVGSNTCIDRGTLEDTVIGDMCKLDNLVQIAHNVKLGKGCIIIAQVGIAGSSKLGDYVIAAGQVGISGHLSISDNTKIAAGSAVFKDTKPNSTLMGFPAQPIKDFWKQTAILKKLITTKGKK